MQVPEGRLLVEFGQGGEFFFVRIRKDDLAVREYLDWPVERGFWSFRALGDGADFAGGPGEKCHDLGCLGVIDSAYADSQVLGQQGRKSA